MAVRSVRNQYRGINAHLHSLWQSNRRWNRFHNYHIGQLMAALKAQLLPIGCTAEMEESLQIRRIGDLPRRPRADILMRDLNPECPPLPAQVPAALMTVEELIAHEEYESPFFAVAIYEQQQADKPVGWVELLSPTNKGSHDDAAAYRAKRRLLMESGMVYVEIDYLHETPPSFATIDDYTKHEPDSHPYRILVIDPRLVFRRGAVFLHEFDVDAPIPTIQIPLNGGDVIEFDADAVYQKTFNDGLYGYDLDYRQLPPNFDRYSPDDQTRIARRMLAVLNAAAAGVDLESGPFPVEEVALADALAYLAALSNPS